VIALLLSLAVALQAGTVSGVLKDAEGRPLAGIRIAAIARTESLDDAIMSPSMSSLAVTDEEGRYKLENIPPGRYFIAAGRLDVQTYYPGTSDLANAKDVAITPGSLVVSAIDFSLGDSSFGRASSGDDGFRGPEASIPLRVTVEGGVKMPVSTAGEFVTLKLDMGIGVMEWLITVTRTPDSRLKSTTKRSNSPRAAFSEPTPVEMGDREGFRGAHIDHTSGGRI
jgi:hypothetical protein